VILLTLVLAFSFAVASVEVHNSSVDEFYSPFENITGEINLTIVGEDYDALITSNDGDEISLGEFLDKSGNLFRCSPPDCSNDYIPSAGVLDKNFSVPQTGDVYVGFVVTGEDVSINSLDFKIESDFEASIRRPLAIKFFERENWKYEGFSNEFLSENWGCYDSDSRVVGHAIGDVGYCEMINIDDTDVLRVGVSVSGNDTEDLKMAIYPDTGIGVEWTCEYNPNNDSYCDASPDSGEIFTEGNYQVCVSADVPITDYKIYEDTDGEICGFVYDNYELISVDNDYAIFAQGVKYGDSSLLADADFSDEDIVAAANDLIGERYGGDCSDGCILPMAFSGVEQNAMIYDAELTYTENFQLDSISDVYDLEVSPVTIDFDSILDGVLDLGALGFSISKTMKYIVTLSGVELFNIDADILPAPIILSVLPLDPPAGVPIKFYAGVNYSSNASLTYTWDFGDNVTEKTNVPFAEHTYAALQDYILTLEVSAGGDLTSIKTFNVGVISPEAAW